eukprot:scaffold2215_cov162-Amphora_coffeaeformis.AAC.20
MEADPDFEFGPFLTMVSSFAAAGLEGLKQLHAEGKARRKKRRQWLKSLLPLAVGSATKRWAYRRWRCKDLNGRSVENLSRRQGDQLLGDRLDKELATRRARRQIVQHKRRRPPFGPAVDFRTVWRAPGDTSGPYIKSTRSQGGQGTSAAVRRDRVQGTRGRTEDDIGIDGRKTCSLQQAVHLSYRI